MDTAPAPHRDERLLNDFAEAAERLRVSRSRLYELVASGALAAVRIGRRRYIRETDLAAFVAGLED